MRLKHFFLLSLLGTVLGNALTTYAADIFIIVPGTWSTQATWYKPKGSFFEALRTSAQTESAHVTTFAWSGENSHAARVAAAEKLAYLIMHYASNSNSTVNLITHSHGSNVGILASQMLARKGHSKKIKHFFALATPVLPEEYAPNMDVIDYFYNFFSLADKVQTAFGLFQRTFLPHDRIANLRVTIHGEAPTHSGIHDPVIAHWLPSFHEVVTNNELYFFNYPGIVHFSDTIPLYDLDEDQEVLVALERDVFTLDFNLRKPEHETNT